MKFLDREASIAKPGFNRWLVPPAALAVHLAIGQIYAYSVFNAPLTKLIGITESAVKVEADDRRLDFQYRTRDAGRAYRPVRHMDGTGRLAQSHICRRLLFQPGLLRICIRRAYAQPLPALFGQRRHRRRRLGFGLRHRFPR